jgi:hypothetical protein
MKEDDNIKKEIGSNSSVLNLSLNDSKNIQEKNDNNSDSCSNSSLDFPKFLGTNIILKKENEEIDLSTSNFESFEIENNAITRKRSRSHYIPTSLINNAPKIKPKQCNEDLISPLTLSIKTYFQDYSCQKNTYNILYDFQKNIVDSKSCDDNLSDTDIFSEETERTTPNINDLNNFSICRKKMKNIINNSKIKSFYEYENILNSDSIFQPTIDLNNKKHNSNQNKKNNFWHKHIVKQKLKSKEENRCTNKNKEIGFSKSKTFNIDEKKILDTQGLFILGVLESAAQEKKKRITTGNCC